jgi:hypothetical protein
MVASIWLVWRVEISRNERGTYDEGGGERYEKEGAARGSTDAKVGNASACVTQHELVLPRESMAIPPIG